MCSVVQSGQDIWSASSQSNGKTVGAYITSRCHVWEELEMRAGLTWQPRSATWNGPVEHVGDIFSLAEQRHMTNPEAVGEQT
jgi:hypothetical protein